MTDRPIDAGEGDEALPEPGYEVWKRERIRAALAEAEQNPDGYKTIEEVERDLRARLANEAQKVG